MNRELIVKAREYKRCPAIRRNLKFLIPAKQYRPHLPRIEQNQEIQIHFEEPIFDEKGNKVCFLAAIDRFSKYPTACIYENAANVSKFLDMLIEIHGISRSIRLDQAKFLFGNQVKTFST